MEERFEFVYKLDKDEIRHITHLEGDKSNIYEITKLFVYFLKALSYAEETIATTIKLDELDE